MRKLLPFVALLLASSLVFGQEKVSGGNTPPASGQTAQDRAAAEKSRREAAKKALSALKGPKDKDKREQGGR